MALRQPSEIIVSRDETPTSREFKITYAYTAQGRIDLITVEDLTSKSLPYAPFSTTGRTRTVDYSYEYHDPNDGKTRLKQIEIDGPRTDVADTTTYNFTTSGYLESVVDAEGNTTTWSGHNGRGQPQMRTDPDGTTHNFTYYPRGWIKQYATGSAIWNFQYWPNGLLKSIAIPAGETIELDYDVVVAI
ncbi:MAG: hypothetical protein IPK00_23550 [Deltaproteobacteria bacterium]|nr:hypothetical protein [Deltaproteobacteria bacterium]